MVRHTHAWKMRKALRDGDKDTFLRYALLSMLKGARTYPTEQNPSMKEVLSDKVVRELIALWLRTTPTQEQSTELVDLLKGLDDES